MSDISLPTDKVSLRSAMKKLRRDASRQDPDAPWKLSENFLKNISIPARAVVAGYIAQSGEMDVQPLMDMLAIQGYALALPAIDKRGELLVFRSYKKGDSLTPGAFQIQQPFNIQPSVEPDILLVPLLAFDHTRHRLGMGGGYYDRTLASLRQKRRILAVGVGFFCQKVASLPTEDHDMRLDRIVTEIEVF